MVASIRQVENWATALLRILAGRDVPVVISADRREATVALFAL